MYIKNKKKRGQSTVEYILLVTAVIAVMIAFFSQNNGVMQTQLNSTLNLFASAINSEAQQYDQSHASLIGGNGTPGYSVAVNPDGT